jgi:hypothetical protein
MFISKKAKYCRKVIILTHLTQVRSPAVRLRLAHCTAWVKRWSEAMDFLQTIFKTNILQNYDFVLRFKSEAKTPEIHAKL